jgi:hypothetical protein
MSRITGTDAANLIEAYNAVYAPQEEVELTEEQVQEDFENWVNSLVEEGHDLSEYTWEDMYEEYLNEMGQRATTGQMTAPRPAAQSPRPAPAAYNPAGGGMGGRRGGGSSPGALRPSFQSTGGFGRYAPPSMQQRTPAPAATQRPAAPARPAAQAPAARPAAPVTSPRPASPATQRPAAPSITSTAFNLARQGVDLSKPSAPTPAAPAKKPSLAAQAAELRAMQAASRQRQGLTQSFDIFDVIKGHLIDEGYADTEEAALQIMANMSEEWKQSIMEGPLGMMKGAASQGKGQLIQNKPTSNASQASGAPISGMIRSRMTK